MIYLLLYVMGGQPKVEVYPTEQAACVQVDVHRAEGARIYKIDGVRRGEPTVSEGVCKAVEQFVLPK